MTARRRPIGLGLAGLALAVVALGLAGPAAAQPLAPSPGALSPVEIRLVDEWVTPSTLFGDREEAHVRVRVSSPAPFELRAADCTGTFVAVGGGSQRLTALDFPAPDYENDGLIGIAGTRPDVAPNEDLGAIGPLHVDAGATVTGTLTFELPSNGNGPRPIASVVYAQ